MNKHTREVQGMSMLLLFQALLASVTFILAFFLWRDRPPTPPSRAEASRREGEQLMPISAGSSEIAAMKRDFGTLLADAQFRKLLVAFGLGLATFNAFSTLVDQIVKPCGYGDDAGLFGAAIIGAGLVGCVVYGPIMERTRNFRGVLRVGFALAGLAVLVFVLVLGKGREAGVILTFAGMGFCMLPILPTTFETAAEATYPISESSSAGLLMMAGQAPSIGVIFLFTYFLERDEYQSCNKRFPIFSIALLALVGLAVLFALLFRGEHKRSMHEGRDSSNALDLDDPARGHLPSDAGYTYSSVA